ncbi:hypothetical protein SAMN06297251_10173 [Fulvimarina manganoxydans]|uniref:Uncharacterized protein n=1 Tax=Fulvimarina manganoxydans TaxID=937218 RepID=A0A1W1Y960_9HYPH|nr:hypothetical protein [Fulvimarina manganoxydans]SMC32697.1 hypothetical protein SAMN06297251_10173 [Fulvimarina manganoxydans]
MTDRNYHEFHIRFFCDCGWSVAPWKGDIFFSRHEVCPKCGSDQSAWKKKVVRFVYVRTEERGFLGIPKTRTIFEEASS